MFLCVYVRRRGGSVLSFVNNLEAGTMICLFSYRCLLASYPIGSKTPATFAYPTRRNTIVVLLATIATIATS